MNNKTHIGFLFLSFLGLSLLILGCKQHKNKNEKQTKKSRATLLDSRQSIHIALLKNMDCFPLYYAQKRGFYRNMPIALDFYDSAFQADSAMRRGKAIGGFMDHERWDYYKNMNKLYTAIIKTDGIYGLAASGALRIREIKDLKDKAVAIARDSYSHEYLKQVLNKNNFTQDYVLCPQINSLTIRTGMLFNHQIDAAVLPEPFLSMAKANGEKLLSAENKNSPSHAMIIVKNHFINKSSYNKQIISSLINGYNKAVKEINLSGITQLSSIITEGYQLQSKKAFAVNIPHYLLQKDNLYNN